jgi:hypothetical protein
VISAAIIGAVVILTVGWQIKYLMERKAQPLVGALLLLIAGSIPAYVGWKTLQPAHMDPAAGPYQAKVSQQITEAQLEIPEGHALLVTATLVDLEEDETDPQKLKTAYNLKVRGSNWEQSASGLIKRDSAGADDAVDVGGAGVRESGRKRSGRLGEDLQDRFEFRGTGAVKLDVTNWSGTAAETLDLEIVEAPPPKSLLWGAVVVLSLIALMLEVRFGADQLAGNVAFLALWAVFLRDGVTPLDGWQEISKAVLPSALLGWGAIGGVAYLGVKAMTSGGNKEPDEEEEEAPAPAPAPESESESDTPDDDEPGEGRRRRRRRRKSDS